MSDAKLKNKVNSTQIKEFISAINSNAPVTVNQVLQALQQYVLKDIYLVDINGAQKKFSQFTENNQNIYDLMKTITERHMIHLGFFCKLIFSTGMAEIEPGDKASQVQLDKTVTNIATLKTFIIDIINFTDPTINSTFENRSTNQFKKPEKRNRQITHSMTQTVVQLLVREFSENTNKRGRKPKPKPENMKEVIKIPQKRGRKPKPKSENMNEPKIPKKRGRKPKEKIYSVLSSNVSDLANLNNNIILHLPIKSSDINDEYDIGTHNLLNYDPNLAEPMPYEPDNVCNLSMIDYNKIPIEEKQGTIKENAMKQEQEQEQESDKKIKTLDQNSTNVETLENVENCENIENKIYNNHTMCLIPTKNIFDTNFEFMDANNKKVWPTKTNIYCYWCVHPFDTPPVPLPNKLLNNKFYVTGCFCSFNCAAAYNFDKDYSDKWERYSLLHLLYKSIHDVDFKNIVLAPPREILQIFGGHLNITEYRKSLINNTKEYKIITPPIIALIPKIEETVLTTLIQNSTFIPVNQNLLDKASLSLRLKREKPISDTNKTLYSYMDLTVSSKN